MAVDRRPGDACGPAVPGRHVCVAEKRLLPPFRRDEKEVPARHEGKPARRCGQRPSRASAEVARDYGVRGRLRRKGKPARRCGQRLSRASAEVARGYGVRGRLRDRRKPARRNGERLPPRRREAACAAGARANRPAAMASGRRAPVQKLHAVRGCAGGCGVCGAEEECGGGAQGLRPAPPAQGQTGPPLRSAASPRPAPRPCRREAANPRPAQESSQPGPGGLPALFAGDIIHR